MSNDEHEKIQTIGIDGDPLTYKIGFAGEETKHVEIKGNGANFYPVVVPEQTRFSQTLAFPRSAGEVEFLMNTYIANLKQRLKCNNVEIWLSGSKNFRSRLATVMKYKGNRDKKRRPYYYDHLREFLCRHHGAQVVEGIEADDILCIRAQEMPGYVIATVDKDLDGAPGMHFKYGAEKDKAEGQKDVYMVSPLEAERNFYTQVLAGDGVDNIVGIPGMGTATARKLLAKAESHQEMYEIALQEYRKFFGDEHEYWHWSAYKDVTAAFTKRELREGVDPMLQIKATPEQLLLENARLVRMLTQRPGTEGFALWSPPEIDGIPVLTDRVDPPKQEETGADSNPATEKPKEAAETSPELDNRGLPWDGRINAKNKSKNKAGNWKYARGVTKEQIKAVEDNLTAAQNSVVTQSPATEEPAAVTAAEHEAHAGPDWEERKSRILTLCGTPVPAVDDEETEEEPGEPEPDPDVAKLNADELNSGAALGNGDEANLGDTDELEWTLQHINCLGAGEYQAMHPETGQPIATFSTLQLAMRSVFDNNHG